MADPTLIRLRQELHEHAELSGMEYETARILGRFIRRHHPTSLLEGIGGTGLAAVYEFPNPGKTIAIRCELDALPILEANQFAHRSKTSGVSHKCGHDGHMAIVSGLLGWLQGQPFDSGKVVLLFQPAEENGKGAHRVLNDERFRALQPDYVFALHNIPGEPLHTVLLMTGGFSAEVQSFIVRLKGRESHASEPENGINPAQGIAEIISGLSGLNMPDPTDPGFAVLTPVHLRMGQISYGISPSDGELHYTVRTWTSGQMAALSARITSLIEGSCQRNGLEHELEWLEYFPASANDPMCNELIEMAARENKLKVKVSPYPFRFGEDFGWYSREYKTAMFGLGAGIATPALHRADYDFPDALIGTGVSMFKAIISFILNENGGLP